jgi:phosphomannomutase
LSDPATTQEIITAYFAALKSSGLVVGQAAKWDSDDNNDTTTRPKFCYTAMHGVGHRFAQQSFQTFELPAFYSVPSQQEPDPNFPTVPFPNPEEPGALNLAKAHAETHHCHVVLANDPDADRLAVAEYNDSNNNETLSSWTDLTGDQIGVLLGHWLWRQHAAKNTTSQIPCMCASTVSSQMLAEIARTEQFRFEDTLTGFKWIGSRAAALHGSPAAQDQTKTYQTLFCYEEASELY